jgi:hypothetical protein
MKLLSKIILNFLILFNLLISNSLAQQTEIWKWDLYKTQFLLPFDFEVLVNINEEFTASNKHVTFSVYPKSGEHLNYATMNKTLQKWAQEKNVKISGTAHPLPDLNGYWGFYLDGNVENGLPVFMGLFVDPDYDDISLYVWISYDIESFDTAKKMLLSFTPI